jgi:hypothetical protein
MMTPDGLHAFNARILRMAWRSSGPWGAMFLEAARALDFKATMMYAPLAVLGILAAGLVAKLDPDGDTYLAIGCFTLWYFFHA